MLHNLFKKYIHFEPIINKKNSFFQSKDNDNNLFRFLKNYMRLLFMPLLHKFHHNFDEYILANYSDDDDIFFESIFPHINSFLIPFI